VLLTRNTYESNGDNSTELKEYDRDSDRREKRRGEERRTSRGRSKGERRSLYQFLVSSPFIII
jgi:hypothetical protein